MVFILKSFYLPRSYDSKKGQRTIDDLNGVLKAVGVSFSVSKNNNGQKLIIKVNEKQLQKTTACKSGRPVKYDLDFDKICEMKKNGKTNKEIFTELGISKSLFYLKMKEYKNNTGHK